VLVESLRGGDFPGNETRGFSEEGDPDEADPFAKQTARKQLIARTPRNDYR